MGTSARKQREIRDREQRILEVGRRMLIEQGFAGLSMDRLAEATEYSKGTLYQHFSTKEDLVTALAIQSCTRRLELMTRASQFDGPPRDRMAAMLVADELFARLHPHFFRSELVIRMADLGERAQAEHARQLAHLEGRCLGLVVNLIEQAIGRGELQLRPPNRPEGVAFTVASLAIGAQLVCNNFPEIAEKLTIEEPYAALGAHMASYLDGLGWRPLSTESADPRGRILSEVFADECRTIPPAGA
ncbi:MAG: helix-turn-helix domain-containing protein [Isosphaeraceae bacterium]